MVRVLFIFLFLFVSCGKSDNPGSKRVEKTYSEADIVNGGSLIIGITGEPDGLNPLTAHTKNARDAISLIYRRLADINEDLSTFSPQLAKSWHFSNDSLSILFELRTDVKWHDGEVFNSEDVVFTYNMHINETLGWEGFSYKENIQRAVAQNDSTVTFYFIEKSPTLLMDAVEGYIVPEHILSQIPIEEMESSTYNRNPIGTGPFQFSEWKSQQSLTLTKFSDYYEKGKPRLDAIVIQIVPDKINLYRQLLSGDIDFMENVLPGEFNKLSEQWNEGDSHIKPYNFLGRGYEFIGWNLIDPENYSNVMEAAGDDEPDLDELLKPHKLFGSWKVRAALTMAIDRKIIIDVVTHGLAIPMHGPIPPIMWAYDPGANSIWEYDVEGAKVFLDDEGWKDTDGDGILDKDGTKFSFEMVTNAGNEERKQSLTIIQQQLLEVGIEMKPRVLEPALLFGRMLPSRNLDAALLGWSVGLKMELTPLFHSSSIFIPFNFVSYRSQEFDKLENAAKRETSQANAQKHWNGIAKLLSWELPYSWLYYKTETTAIHSRFKGVHIDKRGAFINMEEWWIPFEERSDHDMLAEN
ncbi:MAG: hypothetical protein IIB41_04460 [Candidatus Marinimicrobia bacterium]|nr:hypothetical protein [Candidatus Neomarinimicrobiota bacterium]